MSIVAEEKKSDQFRNVFRLENTAMYPSIHFTGFVFAILAGVALGADTSKAGAGNAEKPGKIPARSFPKCPVSGEPIDFKVSQPTQEGPVFFCCRDCVETFQTGPDKYAKTVAAQRAGLAKLPRVQVMCPVGLKPVKTDILIKHEGHSVFFCCKGCPEKFRQNPAKYQRQLAGSYSYQTRCPVEGGPIDPQVSVKTFFGYRIYFCCKGCDEKFLDEFEKYCSSLALQGIFVRPKEMEHDKGSSPPESLP